MMEKHYDLDYLADNHTITHEDNFEEVIDGFDPGVHGRGLIPRDFSQKPIGHYAFAPPFPDSLLINPSEYATRLAAQQAAKTSLFDTRAKFYDTCKSYDQNGYGLCWDFSSTKAATYLRVLMGLPRDRLAPYYPAGKIMNWRDEGGNGDQSMEFIATNGIPLESFCPSYSRKYDTPEAAQNALLHKVTGWFDGGGSSTKNLDIMISACLLGLPWVGDLDWMGHSMAGCYLISLNPLTVAYDNSWGEISQYGPQGLYIIQGNRAIPDNIVVAATIEGSVS